MHTATPSPLTPSPTRRPLAWRTGLLAAGALWLAGCAHQAPVTTANTPEIRQAAVASGLFELVYADGQLYATSAGADRRDGAPGQLLRLDADTLQVQQSVSSPEKPFALVVNRRTNTLYVGHSMHRMISVHDLTTLQRTGTIALQAQDAKGKAYRTRQLLVDEDTNTLYAGSPSDDGPVWVIDGATHTVRTQITGAGGPGLTLDTARQRLYTSGKGFLSVIDLRTQQVIRRHALVDQPDRYLVNAAADPVSGQVFAADSKHGEVVVITPEDGAIVARIPTGQGALAVHWNPTRDALYVTNRQAGTVSVIDRQTLTLRHTLSLPPYPNSLAFGPARDEVYVSIKQPRDAAVAGWRADRLESIARVRLTP